MNLVEIAAPAHTALLTMELQVGVVGEGALLPALAEEVSRSGLLATAGRLCTAARTAGARVVHCTHEARADGAGAATNCRIFGRAERLRQQGVLPTGIGTPGAQLVPEVGPAPEDILVPRLHGMTPFMGTSLDQILRNVGVRTVVATGVSVNLGVFGMVLGALDLGYQVVLVRDAVVGIPPEYAAAVIENSLSMVSTVVTADDLVAAWARV
jgi:nicotinamidase-related amidase